MFWLNCGYSGAKHHSKDGLEYNEAVSHMSLRLFTVLHLVGKVIKETSSLRHRNFDFLYCSCEDKFKLGNRI